MNIRRVAERIRPPRTLLVERPFGALLGEPGDRAAQRVTVASALAMLHDPEVGPGEVRAHQGG